jgi:hypothetical protein
MTNRPDNPISGDVHETPYAPGIVIGYPRLVDWEALYDPNDSRGPRWRHEMFADMRSHHEKDIKGQLDKIFGSATGKAVLAEMKRAHTMRILPSDFRRKQSWTKNAAVTTPRDSGNSGVGTVKAALTAKGAPIYDKGRPMCQTADGGKHVCAVGTGTGVNADIFFASKKYVSPHNPADEALLHEIVHAMRLVNGVMQFLPMNGGYGNLEEFLAVLVANIYRSEKRVSDLYDYADNLINPQSFLNTILTPTPRLALGILRSGQPMLFKALAQVSAAFNPLRQADEELNRRMARH